MACVGDAAARDDLPRADAAGVSARRAARRAGARRAGVDATDEAALAERAGHPVRHRRGRARRTSRSRRRRICRSPRRSRDARRLAPAGARPAAPAPATTCTGSSTGRPLILGGVDDPVRPRRARPLGRRRRLPRGHRRDSRRRRRSATSAGTFPIPIRAGRTRRASICCARGGAIVAERGLRGRQRRRRR